MLLHVREPQHKTNGQERVRKEQILRNKGDSGGGQSESNGKEIWIGWCGGQSDKKSTQTKKGASWKTISREGGRL